MPSDGLITEWSHRGRIGTPGSGGLQIWRPAGGSNYTLVAKSGIENFSEGQNSYPTNLAVKAGDLLGLRVASADTGCYFATSEALDIAGDGESSEPATGETRSLTSVEYVRANVAATFVDTTPPETTITSGPSGTTNNASPSFGFTSSESGSTFECELDGGGFSPCSSPKSYSSLPDGAHNFKVRATDPAGNTDPTPASRDFTVDTTVYKAKIRKVKVKGPARVKRKKKATYKVRITNSGNARANGVKLKVRGKGVKARKTVGSIAAGKTKTVKIRLRFKKPGKVRVSFKVTSKNAGRKTVKKKIKVRR